MNAPRLGLFHQVCVSLAVFAFLSSPAGSLSQDIYNKEAHRVAEAIRTQTGLKLPPDIKDVFALVARQGAQENCAEIEFKWISAPGRKQLLTKKEAEELGRLHELELLGRSYSRK